MKRDLAAVVLAALVGSVQAAHHGNAHEQLFAKRDNDANAGCSCTTIWQTIVGEATLLPKPATTNTPIAASSSEESACSSPDSTTALTLVPNPATTNTPIAASTSEESECSSPDSTTVLNLVPVPVPTPQPHSFSTPGTYTVTPTTITLTRTTTVCAATSTRVSAGTHTLGGVTTAVTAPTTVTVPVASVSTSGSVTTSVIVQTTYVCPKAGTYTIAPITTSVSSEKAIIFPTPTTYAPGTYTAPQKVVTVTETGFVYVCPFTSAGMPTVASTSAPPQTLSTVMLPSLPSSSPAHLNAGSTSSMVPVPVPAASSPAPHSMTAESSAMAKAETSMTQPSFTSAAPSAHASPSSSSVPAPNTNQGGLTSDNDHYGITYTPYQGVNGLCKSADQVKKDIAEFKAGGFTTVRVYSTDCETLEHVGEACYNEGLRMIVGVHVKEPGTCDYSHPVIKEQVDKLAAWKRWDLVNLVVVGNEAVKGGLCTATELKNLIDTVRAKCTGYQKGLFTTAETLNVWLQPDFQSVICNAIDVAGANIHPYFNPNTTPSMAGQFVVGQLHLLKQACHNKEVVNLECGWPTRGTCIGQACPGVSQQAEALETIRKEAGDKTVFFSYHDDLWKNKGECGCEQSWGMGDLFKPKGYA